VTNITIATSDSWKDKQSGEQQERTEWHRVVFFNRLAEIAGEYLRKGSQVYVEGRLQTKKWQDNNGNDRYTTEIVASEMQMLGGRAGGGGGNMGGGQQYGGDSMGGGGEQRAPTSKPAQQQNQPQQSQPQKSGGMDDFDDDIPF